MTEWIPESDRPKKAGKVLVTNKKCYNHIAIEAYYDKVDDYFFLVPNIYHLPSKIPILITHYLILPELSND